METHNLKAASEYLNNLLLARGLLRHGNPIDFAKPAGEGDYQDAPMPRIINLIHDLLMRRDREAEQRESLATTLRTLRNNETKQTLEIERLETKAADLGRSLALASGQERALKATVHDAEATAKSLKEQLQRMKASVQQIRAQCANDLRKRDIEMQKLKSHLAERQRGKRDGLGVTSIMITPPPKNSISRRPVEGGDGLDAPGYTLKQETTEFLTQLCQNLSDENDSLIAIAKRSIQTLRSLQGLPAASEVPNEELDPSSSGGQSNSDAYPHAHDESLPPCEVIARDMDFVLDQLRTLLTNPSFVPLEEVEIRDEEISRLRQGWEEMEVRWRQAVSMMDSWHHRISNGGASINIDDLKQGMGIGLGVERNRRPHGDYDREEAVEMEDAEDCPLRSAHGDSSAPPALEPEAPMVHADLESSLNGSLRRSQRIRLSLENGQADSDKMDEDHDELVLVDNPGLVNVQRRRPKARPQSKIPKQPWTKKAPMTAKAPPNKTRMQSSDEKRTLENAKKRSNSSRQAGQRTRRRTNSQGPTELRRQI